MLVVRSLAFVALFYLWSLIVCLAMTPLFVFPRRWVMRGLDIYSRGISLLLAAVCDIRVERRGAQHMPTGAAVMACKHLCMFDIFGQFQWLPDFCFVMKKELVRVPYLGWYGLKAGMIVVDRGGQATALKKLVRDAVAGLQDGRQVVIFPEGTRGTPGVAGDYKPGVAALYRELGLPVYPVATNSGVHWPAHGFLRRPGTIVFEYLEPIPPGLKRAEFMRTLEERIEAASNRLLEL
ncbi:lysophospholipid acyltransferase family protein [Phenylobacterium sp.]|jgi:1-acyl-sn-glycerol-3-phosphate acyltransferase|uniref:lysophospholipid acyltransferase family protein n=1 Tax=Phenylobacterium sp. TaxID=1871053 RepID=UPI002F3FC800